MRSGRLTPGQGVRLERQQRSIHRQFRAMRARHNGRLTMRERRMIHRRQNVASRRIFRAKRHIPPHRVMRIATLGVLNGLPVAFLLDFNQLELRSEPRIQPDPYNGRPEDGARRCICRIRPSKPRSSCRWEPPAPSKPFRRTRRIARRADHSRQHLSSLSAARARSHSPHGRAASLHQLAARHAHRLRRLSGLLAQRSCAKSPTRACASARIWTEVATFLRRSIPWTCRSRSARTSAWPSTSAPSIPPIARAPKKACASPWPGRGARSIIFAPIAMKWSVARGIRRAARRTSSASCKAGCIATCAARARSGWSRWTSTATPSAASAWASRAN